MSIEKVAELIIALTDEDFAIEQNRCDRYKSHNNPLKPQSSKDLNTIGENNQVILDKIRVLKHCIENQSPKSVGYD